MIRSLFLWLEKRGVPHEETVVMPTLIALFSFKAYEKHLISADVFLYLFLFSCSICGAWLSAAWPGLHFIKIYIRGIYIGVLASAGMIAIGSTVPDHSEGLVFSSSIMQIAMMAFVVSATMASILREAVLSPPLSSEERARVQARFYKLRRLWRLSLGAEKREGASDVEMLFVLVLWLLGALIVKLISDIIVGIIQGL